jgi:lipoprotein NlpD
MRDNLRSTIIVFTLAAFAVGCAGYRPSGDAKRPQRAPVPAYRTVVSGDTLYSIAWDAGQDYRDVARWNGIRSPYLLKPGQQIRLSPPQRDTGRVIVATGDTLSSLAEEIGVGYKDLARWNNIAPPYTIRPGQTLRTTPPGTRMAKTPRSSAVDKDPAPESVSPVDSKGSRSAARVGPWEWPADGSIASRFSASGNNKGLDIAGKRGQPVRAAAPGQVVYKGGGLRGYGQLIIVKHNRDFLSAYAHCDHIYVEEGDVIKRGQKIAAMGNSGTDQVKLHFEIRYRGSPVDPLKYLPRR